MKADMMARRVKHNLVGQDIEGFNQPGEALKPEADVEVAGAADKATSIEGSSKSPRLGHHSDATSSRRELQGSDKKSDVQKPDDDAASRNFLKQQLSSYHTRLSHLTERRTELETDYRKERFDLEDRHTRSSKARVDIQHQISETPYHAQEIRNQLRDNLANVDSEQDQIHRDVMIEYAGFDCQMEILGKDVAEANAWIINLLSERALKAE
jgi:hypothetical protein